MSLRFLATCPAGLGPLLATEIAGLGGEALRETPAGIHFSGGLGLAYRVCLWSRLANRVVLELLNAEVASTEDVYEAVYALNWPEHIHADGSLVVNYSGRTGYIKNDQFGAQKVKDAVVDRFRAASLSRPSVDRESPDVRISARLRKGRLQLGLDLSGDSLHRRGYRQEGGLAPLKENIAAAALIGLDWQVRSTEGASLIDPMCGSATLLLEGALMALDRAPGLSRQRFGFERWLGHDAAQWQAVRGEAMSRASDTLPEGCEIRGYDGDITAVRRAQNNIARLGLEKIVRIRCKGVDQLTRPTHQGMDQGCIAVNPPWGERMGQSEALAHLYQRLGETLSREFSGWQAAVLTSDLALGKAIGLRAKKRSRLQNGRLELHCLSFDLGPENQFRARGALPSSGEQMEPESTAPESLPQLSPGAEALANRLRKNIRKLKAWREREGVSCYRVYDADMPEYAAAIDDYEGRVQVSEYAAPSSIETAAAARRLEDIIDAAQVVFAVTDRRDIAVKTRARQRGSAQYAALESAQERFAISEGKVRALVDLRAYLDTGLFLDHRPLRLRIGEEARGGHFLNLFCYTGVATLHAALGGAVTSTSVDLSKTYLDWFRENLGLNGLSERQHRGVRADVREWLKADERAYDLIMLDPPSFSNSKRADDFDVQRDHVALIDLAMARLSPAGALYFSNNRRGFKLDESIVQRWRVEDISRQTIAPDFARNARIHQCWRLSRNPS